MAALGILGVCAAALGGLAFLRSRLRRKGADTDLGAVTRGWLADHTVSRRQDHAT